MWPQLEGYYSSLEVQEISPPSCAGVNIISDRCVLQLLPGSLMASARHHMLAIEGGILPGLGAVSISLMPHWLAQMMTISSVRIIILVSTQFWYSLQ
ncbi:hypothetical protein CY34DRAFT_810940 [Suillus luteus UH-Slu-Lm8-n1]|uniref:Uncharacterized protein n=1 Tax=Suillus luteus UH-Slu-Lm8-n1 TaxID=930992 RepID=A0A0D0AY81_9AGAM|nr:hypothetical protein CY34DRAFT_810940 [Suillus luteus UH-Slu-Lm8-n1]